MGIGAFFDFPPRKYQKCYFYLIRSYVNLMSLFAQVPWLLCRRRRRLPPPRPRAGAHRAERGGRPVLQDRLRGPPGAGDPRQGPSPSWGRGADREGGEVDGVRAEDLPLLLLEAEGVRH